MFWPAFNRGSILKQNMLETLRDYPYTVLEVQYSEYGNGIISGFDVIPVEGDLFQITPGILKYCNRIYVFPEPLTIEQKTENNYVYLFVHNVEAPDGFDITLRCEQTIEPEDGAFELFRYTKNAEMFGYKDIFEVISNPINRINQIHCNYAVIGGTTLHPMYFKLFGQMILQCDNASISDLAFAYQCLNGINSIEIVKNYFKHSNSNSEIIAEMKTVLDRIRQTTNTQDEKPQKVEPPKKMIVS